MIFVIVFVFARAVYAEVSKNKRNRKTGREKSKNGTRKEERLMVKSLRVNIRRKEGHKR